MVFFKSENPCLIQSESWFEGRSQSDLFFWIHGGSFTMGTSSEYSGFTQVNRGNIVVSINYRLGPLGWLHYYDEGKDIEIITSILSWTLRSYFLSSEISYRKDRWWKLWTQ